MVLVPKIYSGSNKFLEGVWQFFPAVFIMTHIFHFGSIVKFHPFWGIDHTHAIRYHIFNHKEIIWGNSVFLLLCHLSSVTLNFLGLLWQQRRMLSRRRNREKSSNRRRMRIIRGEWVVKRWRRGVKHPYAQLLHVTMALHYESNLHPVTVVWGRYSQAI